jgi:uncharacterized membrane-anchored protein
LVLTIEDVGSVVAGWAAEPYIVALAVPVAFYLVGAFSKKIIREGGADKPFFVLSDWFLAPDALLVAVGSMLAELAGLLSKFDPANHRGQIRGIVVLLAISVCVYVVVLALHRHYEPADKHSTRRRCWWLVIVANAFALMVMMMWLVAVKGIDHV